MPATTHPAGPWSAATCTTDHGNGTYSVAGPASNWIIVRERNRFMLIDAGYPADVAHVLASLRHLGLEPAEASAVLLTHAHVDHMGGAAYFAHRFGTPVLCSPQELPQVQGRIPRQQVTLLRVLAGAWRPTVLRWMVSALRAGALRAQPVETASAWTPEALQQLPGRPQPILLPGHTDGSSALYLPAAKAAVTGDAVVTGHPLTPWTGPQLTLPMFSRNPTRAAEALSALRGVDATLVLPGHGPALRKPLQAVVQQALRAAGAPGGRGYRRQVRFWP
jgi:glyoxylase-like metal-dependent hydrolase (beta-lactamase superfamily II)